MRVFLRVNAPFFINWGMEMLIGQLYDTELSIAEEAIDILDEACEEEVSP
jgi:rapamycin-insensitive companion of mTOR